MQSIVSYFISSYSIWFINSKINLGWFCQTEHEER